MVAQNTSSGSSQSQSNSSSYIPNYSEEPFLLSMANYAKNLSEQQFGWAQQQFGNTSGVTADTVQKYLTGAVTAHDTAKDLAGTYGRDISPAIDQLATDANSYGSVDRQKYEMGRASAEAGQAGESARQNALKDLASYGIDPSAGRYGALDRAERVQTAASQASAADQAYRATAGAGRGLRSELIGAGQYLVPEMGSMINAEQAGLAGAENATLANVSSGASTMGTAPNWASIADQLKYPPLGNASQSEASSHNESQGTNSGGGMINTQARFPTTGGSDQGYPQTTPMRSPQPSSSGYNPMGGNFDFNSEPYLGGTSSAHSGAGGGSGTSYAPGPPSAGIYNIPQSMQFNGGGGSFSSGGGSDAGGGDFSSAGGGSGGGDFSSPESETSFDAGGEVPDGATTGGGIPMSASPSMGQQTDDVPARLNAGEFVIPRDAHTWYGEKFFQDLIAKARKARMQAQQHGAHAQMKPALPGQPRFQSQSMAGGLQ